MYKLILVDDEETIIRGLSNYINWNNLGFELVGTANSVAQALKLVRTIHVDVVLSDIHMEDGTGLDLIKQLNIEFPDVKSIILSGYGEFTYAQQALRLGTFDFLTKPVEFDVLHETFKKLYTLLEESSKSYNFSQFNFNDLITNKIAVDNDSLCEYLGYKKDEDMYISRIKSVNEIEMDSSIVLKFFENNYKHVKYNIFTPSVNEVAILFQGVSPEEIKQFINNFINQENKNILCGISNPFNNFSEFNKTYYLSEKVLNYTTFSSSNNIIYYKDVENTAYSTSVLTEEQTLEISELLNQKDIDGLVKYSNLMVGELSQNINLVYAFCVEFYLIIDRFLHNYLVEYSDKDTLISIKSIFLKTSPQDIALYISNYLNSLKTKIEQANPYSSDIIHKVRDYINENYKENITLQTLADQFFLHPIYLSKLFKSKTGQNFIDYLTYVRFTNAKRILTETNLKVYEISEMCGYESSKYFSKIFKVLSGQTPKEYRKIIGAENIQD